MPHDRPARECRPRTFARKDTHLFLFRLPLRAKMRKKAARLSIIEISAYPFQLKITHHKQMQALNSGVSPKLSACNICRMRRGFVKGRENDAYSPCRGRCSHSRSDNAADSCLIRAASPRAYSFLPDGHRPSPRQSNCAYPYTIWSICYRVLCSWRRNSAPIRHGQHLCLVLEIESSQIFATVHIFVFLTAAKVGHLIASLFWTLTNRI